MLFPFIFHFPKQVKISLISIWHWNGGIIQCIIRGKWYMENQILRHHLRHSKASNFKASLIYINFLGPKIMWGVGRISRNEMTGIFGWMILIYCRNSHQWELSRLLTICWITEFSRGTQEPSELGRSHPGFNFTHNGDSGTCQSLNPHSIPPHR